VQKQLENVSILVIEDEPIIALDLQYLLESSGAAPVTLEHALDGARQRLSGPALPDVVILDLVLGGTSSLPLAEELRHKRVPFFSPPATPSASHPASRMFRRSKNPMLSIS